MILLVAYVTNVMKYSDFPGGPILGTFCPDSWNSKQPLEHESYQRSQLSSDPSVLRSGQALSIFQSFFPGQSLSFLNIMVFRRGYSVIPRFLSLHSFHSELTFQKDERHLTQSPRWGAKSTIQSEVNQSSNPLLKSHKSCFPSRL